MSSEQTDTEIKMKTKRPLFICFIGIDGAGKSTHAGKLYSRLLKQDYKVKYIWNRFDPWLLRPVMWAGRKLFLKNQDMFEDYKGYRAKKVEILKFPVIIPLFNLFYIGEYIIRTGLRVGFTLLSGYSIICDRYYFDIVAGFSTDNKYSKERSLRLYKMLKFLLPKPDVVFLFDAPEEIAFERKDDIPSIEFLREKRHIYNNLAKIYRIKTVNGLNPTHEIDNYLISEIEKLE